MSIQPRTRQEDDMHLRWLEMYDAGQTPAQIAAAFDAKAPSVRGILHRIRLADAQAHGEAV